MKRKKYSSIYLKAEMLIPLASEFLLTVYSLAIEVKNTPSRHKY